MIIARIALMVALLSFLILPGQAWAAPQDEIYASLKSPTCTTDTLDKCQGEVAQKMRQEIQQKLSAGETKEQIIAYYVAQYGEGIRAVPKKQGFDLVAWVIPIVAVIGGGALIYLAVNRWTKNNAAKKKVKTKKRPVDAVDNKRIKDEINRYL